MRRIGARALAFLAVAIASFALWSGLALAGSSATSGGGTDDTGTVTRSQLIQTQTPDGEETPDADETPGRRPCPRDRNGGSDDTTESTETSSEAV
jgi:hypothetical protein